jgi:6-phosphogluconolactonase (cycloisomerase 2 family)
MISISDRRSPIRDGVLVLAFGAFGTLLQFACGGSNSSPPPAPVAPYITSFTAGKTQIAAGSSTTLTAVFTFGTGTVDKGVGAVTSGTAVTVNPTADTTYTLNVVNSAGTSVTATTSVAVLAAPAAPVVTAPANVTSGQAGYTASVPAVAGLTYAWTITNGTITAGAATNTVTFTAGGTGSVGLSCKATNVVGTDSTPGTASSAIVAAPTVPVLTVPVNVLANQTGCTASTPAQAGCTYVWTLSNGTITSGNGANITFTAGASGIVGFSCVAANAAGTTSAAGTSSSAVVVAPTKPVITAPANVTTGQGGYTASVPAQVGSTYAWTLTNGSVTAGAGTPSITFSAGVSGTVGLSCVVTNAAGPASAPGTASATIVPFPAISEFSASTYDVLSGAPSTLSCAFSGGTAVINPGNITVAASGGTTVVRPTANTTYTLTVTNPAGTVTTDTLTVTVGAAPAITAFNAASSTITTGQGTLLSFAFTGDGVVTPGNIPVTTGSQLAVFPAATTTYTLTSSSSLGGTPATATATVNVKAFTSKFVYVANAGGGVSGFSMNETTGALTELGNSPFDDSVQALHVTSDPQGKFLFVVNGDGQEETEHQFTVFQINQANGDLTKVNSYETGDKPWASAVDPSGKFVYVRSKGSISAFSLNGTTGALTPLSTPTFVTAAGTGEVLIHPSGQYLFTVGRSSDQLQVFNLNATTGALSLNASYGLAAGTGPLSLALSHGGDYLFTKSEGAAGGDAQECFVYQYYLDVQTGGLTPLATTDTGLLQADAYHGVSANPTQPVVYITLATSDSDFAGYALDLNTGVLTPLSSATYALFGGTGSDSLVVSRNGKWGFMTDYNGSRIAVGAVDPTTGVLTSPAFVNVGLFPVSVCVVGTVQ